MFWVSLAHTQGVQLHEIARPYYYLHYVMKCSGVLHCSDGLSNNVSNIIRRFMDNMKLLFICILRVLLSPSFIFFRFYFFINIYIYIYIWFYSCFIMYFMYSYCYDYVFSLYVCVWLRWLRFFRAFSSVVRRIPG
jgi:hypothetical protein